MLTFQMKLQGEQEVETVSPSGLFPVLPCVLLPPSLPRLTQRCGSPTAFSLVSSPDLGIRVSTVEFVLFVGHCVNHLM